MIRSKYKQDHLASLSRNHQLILNKHCKLLLDYRYLKNPKGFIRLNKLSKIHPNRLAAKQKINGRLNIYELSGFSGLSCGLIVIFCGRKIKY